MKWVKTTVNYKVPHWNFCNVDRFDYDATASKQLCRFCQKTREGYRCALYDQSLLADHGRVSKALQCCETTAGFPSVIEREEIADVPTISPKDLMKHAIEAYTKTVEALINQGYPRAIAEQVAKKHVLGDK